MIKISKDLSLPMEAVTQTFAQIGRKGAGKTYLASMIAEQMLDAKAQVIVIDPIGNWWGLRVDSDGKSKGKDIFVIGGRHGDIPISSEAGKEIAKILTEKSISAVLDISEFRKNERKKFVTDFAEEFYHLKKSKPSAVHIFLEESQKFVPQMVQKDDARMLGAWEDIVRLGRNYGIGCSLISQRPQSVNKEVLSQVECLCVLQINGLHERKALEEWVQEAGEDRKIVGELPSLQRGEGYVWSPSWLKIFKKVQFAKKSTMDTSATPELGKKTEQVAKLSKVDIEKLQKFMTEMMNNSKIELKEIADYKREILRLKNELTISKQNKPIHSEPDSKTLQQVSEKAYRNAESQYLQEINRIKHLYNQLQRLLEGIGQSISSALTKYPQEIKKEVVIEKPKLHIPVRSVPQVTHVNQVLTSELDSGKLGKCEKKLYSFLYAYPDRAFTKSQIGAVTGYSCNSGGFNNALSRLGSLDLINKNGNSIQVKGMDSEIATAFDFSIKNISNVLNKCEKEIYEVLLNNPSEEFSKESLAELTQTKYSCNSGGFNNSLSRLKTLGLINKSGNSVSLNQELLEL